MYLLMEEMVRDHIRELHREAAAGRRALGGGPARRPGRAKAGVTRRAAGRALVSLGMWLGGTAAAPAGTAGSGGREALSADRRV